jgi:ABC-type Co2+ transport system permease subunit
MIRERAQKVVLVIVGLFFVATVYGLVKLREEKTLQMMLSIYVTLGVFLLVASRNPSANRSLITFTAWSSFAHAAVMAVQSLHDVGERAHLLGGSLAFVVIGVALIVLAPTKARVVGSRSALSAYLYEQDKPDFKQQRSNSMFRRTHGIPYWS